MSIRSFFLGFSTGTACFCVHSTESAVPRANELDCFGVLKKKNTDHVIRRKQNVGIKSAELKGDTFYVLKILDLQDFKLIG